VGPLQLPAPSVRGGVGSSTRRVGAPGPLFPVRLAVAARVLAQPRAPERPLPVNRLADHPDLHTCPSCGPPERS
jgi:hypothetical protein